MNRHWLLKCLEIRGGFLDGLSVEFPPGLTCVIGPRGSGKSTLAEAIRYAVSGHENAPKPRLELFKSNLARSVIILRTCMLADGNAYEVRREPRQPAIVTTALGKALPSVDLDRGTFLPLDAYGSFEIEQIADESFGSARRALLDELEMDRLTAARQDVLESLRALQSNGDAVTACKLQIEDLVEKIHSLSHARDHLAALPASADGDEQDTVALRSAARQNQTNATEFKGILSASAEVKRLRNEVSALAQRFAFGTPPLTQPESANAQFTVEIDSAIAALALSGRRLLSQLDHELSDVLERLVTATSELQDRHANQAAFYASLREKNVAAGEAARQRAEAEDAAQRLDSLERELRRQQEVSAQFLNERRGLRAEFNRHRDRISDIRDDAVSLLQRQAGDDVRIRLRRNADDLEYQQLIASALHGIGVKQHDQIVEGVKKLRPDELAQLIDQRNVSELESVCGIGLDRAGRVMEGLRRLNTLDLETLGLDDEVAIELNVGSRQTPHFRDASSLSRGQKCTALLPILLARRDVPLLIDQPEDNLDNHFIFHTIVDTILRVKPIRQMIFITHNANIPVLAEADQILVLGSDGEKGYVSKAGTLDAARPEIIDLLEGGREAFERRRERYGR